MNAGRGEDKTSGGPGLFSREDMGRQAAVVQRASVEVGSGERASE